MGGKFKVSTSSLNMVRVAYDLFGPLHYLSKGGFYLESNQVPGGILMGNADFVWNPEASFLWGPPDLLENMLLLPFWDKKLRFFELICSRKIIPQIGLV